MPDSSPPQMVCVPVEPTRDMLGAWYAAKANTGRDGAAYHDLIAAAPSSDYVPVPASWLPMMLEAVVEREKVIRKEFGSVYGGEPGEQCADDWLVLADELRSLLSNDRRGG